MDGILSRRQTVAVAVVGYALAAGLGALIVLGREPMVLPLGLVGITLAYFYHAPPLRLAYRGLGELAVALTYGPLIAAATFLIQHGYVSLELVAVAFPLGLVIAAFLLVNELPDRRADAACGKMTLAVRLGPGRATVVYIVATAIAFAALPLLTVAGLTPWILLGLLGLIPASRAVRTLLSRPTRAAELVPAQTATLDAFLSLAGGLGIGLLLGGSP